MIDWLIDLLVDWLIDWLTDWLIDWLTERWSLQKIPQCSWNNNARPEGRDSTKGSETKQN